MTALACAAPEPIDLAAWAGLPVACVPLGGVFEPVTAGQRLLVAGNGLFIEAASPALYARLQLADATTPWGASHETLELRHGLIPRALARQLSRMAMEAHPKEMAALIVADADTESRYRLLIPEGAGGVGHITYGDTDYAEGALVIDAHSHGPYPAQFSATDDHSDRSRLEPHISLVFGSCATPMTLSFAARLCIGHYLIPLPNTLIQGCFA